MKKNPEWIFDVEGNIKLFLKFYRMDGSVLHLQSSVTVYPKPKAHFEIFPENAVIPDDEITFPELFGKC